MTHMYHIRVRLESCQARTGSSVGTTDSVNMQLSTLSHSHFVKNKVIQHHCKINSSFSAVLFIGNKVAKN